MGGEQTGGVLRTFGQERLAERDFIWGPIELREGTLFTENKCGNGV